MRTDNWYVLQVRTGRELAVAEAAKELEGVETIVPIQALEERHEGDWITAHKLLYPSYVFVRTERLHAERYYEFKRLDGVIRLLGLADGDIPRSVPETEMAELLALMDTNQLIGMSEGIRKDNGKVEIVAGPLAGLTGKIIKVDARQRRATVRLSLMGRTQAIRLALAISNPTEPEAEQSPRAEDG